MDRSPPGAGGMATFYKERRRRPIFKLVLCAFTHLIFLHWPQDQVPNGILVFTEAVTMVSFQCACGIFEEWDKSLHLLARFLSYETPIPI